MAGTRRFTQTPGGAPFGEPVKNKTRAAVALVPLLLPALAVPSLAATPKAKPKPFSATYPVHVRPDPVKGPPTAGRPTGGGCGVGGGPLGPGEDARTVKLPAAGRLTLTLSGDGPALLGQGWTPCVRTPDGRVLGIPSGYADAPLDTGWAVPPVTVTVPRSTTVVVVAENGNGLPDAVVHYEYAPK